MRAPATDLPLMLEDVSLLARETAILDHVTLQFMPGAPTMLIGPNGSGKTSLMRVAMGLVAPSSGRVTYGGRSDVPPVRRAIVFQRPAMLRRSAKGNLRYALAAASVPRAEREERAAQLLSLVGLVPIGERPARKLSGGEQQRLAIARALAKDPDILFLDEPTASLDPAAAKATEDIIRDIAARGIKIVMSTHDLAQARRLGGDIVLLHRGRVVETADRRHVLQCTGDPRSPSLRRRRIAGLTLQKIHRENDMIERRLFVALAATALLASWPAAAQEKSIVVSSTTSTTDSGLFNHILPLFKKKTGIDVKVVSQGTGQALDTGRRGDADVVFVHARPQEEKFVAEGCGREALSGDV